jgi:hypothetical protein
MMNIANDLAIEVSMTIFERGRFDKKSKSLRSSKQGITRNLPGVFWGELSVIPNK